MDILPNPPLKEGSSEGIFPRLVAADRLTRPDPADGSAPPLRDSSVPPQNIRAENSRAAEIPIAELKLLAVAHGLSDDTSVAKRTSHSRVYIFFAALIGIGAFVVWQSYGATEKPNTALASSLAFSGPVSKEVAPATSELVASSPSTQGVTDPANIKSNVSPATPPAPSSEAERLDAIVNELAIVRQELKQLAANHEELARNIAALQPTRETAKQKLPPSNVPRAAPSQRKISSTPPLQVGPLPSSPPPAPPTNQTAISDHGANIPRPPSSMPEN
jgi:hypothetical protein